MKAFFFLALYIPFLLSPFCNSAPQTKLSDIVSSQAASPAKVKANLHEKSFHPKKIVQNYIVDQLGPEKAVLLSYGNEAKRFVVPSIKLGPDVSEGDVVAIMMSGTNIINVKILEEITNQRRQDAKALLEKIKAKRNVN